MHTMDIAAVTLDVFGEHLKHETSQISARKILEILNARSLNQVEIKNPSVIKDWAQINK